jgi:aminoglycoside phosphotransferase family enzyme/predicted kinase
MEASGTAESTGQPSTQHLPRLLAALQRPDAYATPPHGPVQSIQTHASLVVLAGDRAYKIKKARDFGFFDYSTPELRRHFCALETILNARLAPSVYLGVAPVLAQDDGRIQVEPERSPDDLPVPGQRVDGGQVIDYAVVMRRLPEEATLAARVRRGQIAPVHLKEIARVVARFHSGARADAEVARFGGLETIHTNWEENFAQMRPYVGRALSAGDFAVIERNVRAFLDERATLFSARVAEGRVRDCHGDLRLQHVYLFESDAPAQVEERIAVVDCIEFNDRFRYSDVAAEVAFLAMELDLAARADLARAFLDAYVAASGDESLRELLPFYLCYRACVRGKVTAFQLDEAEIAPAQREAARQEATALFGLAAEYARGSTKQALVLVGGLMGSGKSTLAEALCAQAGYALVASDAERKRLVGLDPAQPVPDTFGAGIYSAEWSARTYRALLDAAGRTLAAGRSVVLDASFARRADRRDALDLARAISAQCIFVEAVCPRDMTLARLAARWQARQGGADAGASDGRPALYDAQRAAWEPFDSAAEDGLRWLTVDTRHSPARCAAELLAGLGVAERACWLA